MSVFVLSLSCFGCSFIQEKLWGKQAVKKFNAEEEDDKQTNQQKLKEPIPINPSHS